MNKLQEAGKKVRERIYNLADSEGRLEYGTLDIIEEMVREVCAEYARSKLLFVKEVSFKSELDSVERQKFVEEHLKIMFDEYHKALHDGIDQDLLSLKEKNI